LHSRTIPCLARALFPTILLSVSIFLSCSYLSSTSPFFSSLFCFFACSAAATCILNAFVQVVVQLISHWFANTYASSSTGDAKVSKPWVIQPVPRCTLVHGSGDYCRHLVFLQLLDFSCKLLNVIAGENTTIGWLSRHGSTLMYNTTPCNNTKHMKMKKRFTVLTQRTGVFNYLPTAIELWTNFSIQGW
jgi:hypothetical protein